MVLLAVAPSWFETDTNSAIVSSLSLFEGFTSGNPIKATAGNAVNQAGFELSSSLTKLVKGWSITLSQTLR